MKKESDTVKTAVGSCDLLGLGVRILPDERRIELLFEGDDLAEDEFGNPAPAGFKIAVTMKGELPEKSLDEYESAAAKIEAEGIEDYNLPPGKIRRLTWEQFIERGYAD